MDGAADGSALGSPAGVINGTDHLTPEGLADEQADGTLLPYTDGAADDSVDGASDSSALGSPDGVIDGKL